MRTEEPNELSNNPKFIKVKQHTFELHTSKQKSTEPEKPHNPNKKHTKPQQQR